jgi:putative ABC transport system permease protein
MPAPRKLPAGVRRLFRLPWSRARALEEVNEEMRFHLDMRAKDLRAKGLTAAQAEAEALRRFGDMHDFRSSSARTAQRHARMLTLSEWARAAAQDVRLAVRRLSASPVFTIAAMCTLAVATGATASVFGLVDGVMLRAFPYQDLDRVMTLWESNTGEHLPQATVATGTYLDWAAQSTSFSKVGAATTDVMTFTVVGAHDAERLHAQAVTPGFFDVLGIRPAIGRRLTADSTVPPSEVMLSYGYWQEHFGGAPSVLGQTLTLDNPNDQSPPPHNHHYTIVGVMPSGLASQADLWTQIYYEPDETTEHDSRFLFVYGRLKPGATREGAQQELAVIAQRVAAANPITNHGWGARVIPMRDQLVGAVRPALVMLLAAAACVLLIGAANLANLFLVRCLARQREMALRAALGARRGRLVRELVIEATVLSLAAGALGIGVTVEGVHVLRSLAPPTLPRLNEVGVDGRVLAFCALSSIATVFVFGLLPAWQASRGDLAAYLKEGGRGTGSAQHHRLQDVLVVLQMAIALVLLTGAGLFVRGFEHFRQIDPGFRADGVLTAELGLPRERYTTPERQDAFLASLTERLIAEPGVTGVSTSVVLPGQLTNPIGLAFTIVDDPPPEPGHVPAAFPDRISPGYFHTLGIKLLRGRGILATDSRSGQHVAVVDELLARRFFGSADPLGRRIAFMSGIIPDTAVIVGIVAHVREFGLVANDGPMYYLPLTQNNARQVGSSAVAIRTARDPEAQTGALRAIISSLDPTVAVSHVETLTERQVQTVGTTRFESVLASLFAVVGMLLGMVGIYSVLAYVVAQRQRETAVRMALGASRSHVMGDVLRRALVLAGIGIALGSVAAWILTQLLAGLFLGVRVHDPVVFLGAAAAFALVALGAASIPALRTTRVNPVAALTST